MQANRVDTGFAPIAREDARVLVLGSLPGRMSLAHRQYYALPRNAFWRIMGGLVGAGAELPYDERTARLVARQIAVWDVCAAAERPGSLDAAIVRTSVVPNDFAAFFEIHKKIELIAFNGGKATELFQRHVAPNLPRHTGIKVTLPSTSPAHASLSVEAKLARWRDAILPVIERLASHNHEGRQR